MKIEQRPVEDKIKKPRGALRHIARWDAKARSKTVQTLLNQSLKDRLPELTSLRYERMTASPFGFFRGSASVMAYDLSLGQTSDIHAQLCGDAHLQNLGAFEGDAGRLTFDINDFDETIAGPFEWDLKRMATSIFLAGRDAEQKESAILEAAGECLEAYIRRMQCFLPMPVLEVARFQVHRIDTVAPISRILAQAERATPLLSLEKLTSQYPRGRVFRTIPPTLRRIEGKEADTVLASLKPYVESLLPERRHFFARFRPVDVAFKVVGTGSVGLRDYTIYLEGNGPTDPLFLQIKQESPSCYAPYLKQKRKVHEGRRVVEGQRAMQLQSDPLLGWTSIGKYDYLVRQLNDHKASIEIEKLKAEDLSQYASVCGEMLARGHARSGDVREMSAFIGKGGRFRKAILQFASAYSQQMEVDWKHFKASQKT